MNVVLERKKQVLQLLDSIEKYPSTGLFKHEMMTYGYVIVCGAIEFMVESVLREWLYKTVKQHKNSSHYSGKERVEDFLSIQLQFSASNIDGFFSTKLDNIRGLVAKTAGDNSKIRFNSLLTRGSSLQPDVNARLERINRFRHDLAHGSRLPHETQPNITELKEDFLFVYKYIVLNIKKSLPPI